MNSKLQIKVHSHVTSAFALFFDLLRPHFWKFKRVNTITCCHRTHSKHKRRRYMCLGIWVSGYVMNITQFKSIILPFRSLIGLLLTNRVFHKRDEIGNNANIGIRDFTMWKQKFPITKCYPQWGLKPGPLIPSPTLSFQS